MKQCKTCKSLLPLSEYHKHKLTKDGLFPECKACHRDRQRKWAQNNKDKHAGSFRTWQQNNPHKNSERQKRYKATKKSLTPTLAETPLCRMIMEEIYWFRDFCTEVTGKAHDVDHVMPLSKGGEHAPWNLAVLTASQNRSKGNKLDVAL